MKDYKEMAESVLKRRDIYVARKRRQIKMAASVLSIVCVVSLAGAGISTLLLQNGSNTDAPRPTQELLPLATANGANTDRGEDMRKEEKEPEFGTGIDGDPEGYSVSDKYQNKENNEEPGETDPMENSTGTVTCIDMPVAENPGSTGTLTAYEAIWGGSYMDETGNIVVLLTENTEANREKIFQLNPSLTESTTSFRDADYTLAYLTELMANISAEMGVDGKIPFVITAALREERNRVEVTMTERDEDSLAKILAFDRIGGAIEVQYASDAQGNVEYDLIK